MPKWRVEMRINAEVVVEAEDAEDAKSSAEVLIEGEEVFLSRHKVFLSSVDRFLSAERE